MVSISLCLWGCIKSESAETHPGKFTWVVPTGTISIDFPQNLFLFHMKPVQTNFEEGGKSQDTIKILKIQMILLAQK